MIDRNEFPHTGRLVSGNVLMLEFVNVLMSSFDGMVNSYDVGKYWDSQQLQLHVLKKAERLRPGRTIHTCRDKTSAKGPLSNLQENLSQWFVVQPKAPLPAATNQECAQTAILSSYDWSGRWWNKLIVLNCIRAQGMKSICLFLFLLLYSCSNKGTLYKH